MSTADLCRLEERIGGRVGACCINIKTGETLLRYRSTELFPLQSVMKLIAAAATFSDLEKKGLRADSQVVLTSDDVSPGPRRLAGLIRSGAVTSLSILELLSHAIIESDSTSIDAVLRVFGGTNYINQFLSDAGISGLRVDRNERTLQCDIVGLEWNPTFADLTLFDSATSHIPVKDRDKAWKRHLADDRDRATPEGCANFLKLLYAKEIVSEAVRHELLRIMRLACTGVDRLRAGIGERWRLAHKTGTGPEWRGQRESVSDIGILESPDGEAFAVAAFITESCAPIEQQDGVIAQVARMVVGASGAL